MFFQPPTSSAVAVAVSVPLTGVMHLWLDLAPPEPPPLPAVPALLDAALPAACPATGEASVPAATMPAPLSPLFFAPAPPPPPCAAAPGAPLEPQPLSARANPSSASFGAERGSTWDQ